MALRLKKQYENQTLVLVDGTLIDAKSVSKPNVQKRIQNAPSLAYMFEEDGADDTPKQPVTGGGGAGDPRPKKTRTRKK